LSDFAGWYDVLHGDIDPSELSHDERLFAREAAVAAEAIDWDEGPWRVLTEQLKAATGRKGRDLYHPLRVALTGRESGPEMAGLVERMGKARALERLNDASRR
jgi:glutamyl-tRNA synthetase